jgi:DNA polymerase III delta prime subunit
MSSADTLISELLKRVFEAYDRRRAAKVVRRRTLEEALAAHLSDVATWSGRIELFGFAAGRDTDAATIDLFVSLPRKFKGRRAAGGPLGEEQLLDFGRHHVLLGDPGGGKTTTLKRLSRRLLQEPRSRDDRSEYPLVVRLRELNAERVLDEALADALGIPHVRLDADAKELAKSGITLSEHPIFTGVSPSGPFIVVSDGQLLHPKIARVIDDTGALVLLDGLDEVPGSLRLATEGTITRLALTLRQRKIVVSCRSGDYTTSVDGFDTLEICPLTNQQISQIARRWCEDPKAFLQQLKSLPFADLATRPLFLCQLILLFESTGFLPVDPSAVYRRVVRLALEEWDRQKRVVRPTKYGRFDPDRKLKFLSHLAFHLTYVIKAKQFTTDNLVGVYRAICGNFGLPREDALSVVRELESHTGILVESGVDRFEFSHLSLQEYLCAEFLVGSPMTDKIADYLVHNPAPVAVAVALSAHPARWLGSVFLRKAVGRAWPKLNFPSFFARLEQEAPEFAVDKLLGFAALRILFRNPELDSYTARFLDRPAVAASVASVLTFYTARVANGYLLSLHQYRGTTGDTELPTGGRLDHLRVESIRKHAPVEFKAVSH